MFQKAGFVLGAFEPDRVINSVTHAVNENDNY